MMHDCAFQWRTQTSVPSLQMSVYGGPLNSTNSGLRSKTLEAIRIRIAAVRPQILKLLPPCCAEK